MSRSLRDRFHFMSLFPGAIYGGFGIGGFAGFPQIPQVVDPLPETVKAPKEGEEARRQGPLLPFGGSYGGFVGYPDTPAGGYGTWRLMESTCPTLILTMAAILGPILSGVPAFEVRTPDGSSHAPKKGPLAEGEQRDPLDQRASLIERMFMPFWDDLMFHACRSLALGHYPFELVWERRTDAANWLKCPRPLHPEWSTLLVDDHDNLVGVRAGNADLIGPKAFNCHWGAEARNWYGRPRYENIRLEWWRQMQDDRQGSRLDEKAAGNVFAVYIAPNKQWRDAAGNVTDPRAAGKTLTDQLSTGHNVYVPLMVFDEEAIKAKPELANVSAVKIERFDLGNVGPSQEAILKKLEYRDKRIVRGLCRPERSILEAVKGGSRADSLEHGDVGLTDSEYVQSQLYGQISTGCIDWVLRLNFGNDAAGSVYAKPSPLADPQIGFLQDLILKIIATGPGAQILLPRLDEIGLFNRLEVPALDEPREMPTPPPSPFQQQPGANGNGQNGDGQQDEPPRRKALPPQRN